MNHDFDIEVSKTISAAPAQVWQAITEPSEVKQWMFGTEVDSTWRQGDRIAYRGSWEGEAYEDVGTILAIVPRQILRISFFGHLSKKEDSAENRHVISYEIIPAKDVTTVVVRQENNQSRGEADTMEANWTQLLDSLEVYLAISKK